MASHIDDGEGGISKAFFQAGYESLSIKRSSYGSYLRFRRRSWHEVKNPFTLGTDIELANQPMDSFSYYFLCKLLIFNGLFSSLENMNENLTWISH
jgi:hypothetical protein